MAYYFTDYTSEIGMIYLIFWFFISIISSFLWLFAKVLDLIYLIIHLAICHNFPGYHVCENRKISPQHRQGSWWGWGRKTFLIGDGGSWEFHGWKLKVINKIGINNLQQSYNKPRSVERNLPPDWSFVRRNEELSSMKNETILFWRLPFAEK